VVANDSVGGYSATAKSHREEMSPCGRPLCKLPVGSVIVERGIKTRVDTLGTERERTFLQRERNTIPPRLYVCFLKGLIPERQIALRMSRDCQYSRVLRG